MMAAIAALLLSGCAGASQGVAPDWIGTDRAQRTAAMQDDSSGELPRETLLDEASLEYYDATSACFDLIVRATLERDETIGDRGPRCATETEQADGSLSSETVSVYDYNDRGDVETVQTEGTPAAAFERDSVGAVEPGLLRVVERHGRVCCSIGAADTLALTIGSASFRWELP